MRKVLHWSLLGLSENRRFRVHERIIAFSLIEEATFSLCANIAMDREIGVLVNTSPL